MPRKEMLSNLLTEKALKEVKERQYNLLEEAAEKEFSEIDNKEGSHTVEIYTKDMKESLLREIDELCNRIDDSSDSSDTDSESE